MYTTPDLWKKSIYRPSRQWELKATIHLADGSAPLQITSDDLVEDSVKMMEAATCGDSIQVGSTFANSFEFTLANHDGRFTNVNFQSARIVPHIYLKNVKGTEPTENEWTSIPLGAFNLIDVGKKLSVIPIKCFDDWTRLTRSFSSLDITLPAKAHIVLNEICTMCNVQYADSLYNKLMLANLEVPLYEWKDVSCRDLLAYMAVCLGENLRFNRAGILDAFWYTEASPPLVTTSDSTMGSPSYEDLVVSVSGVSIKAADGTEHTTGTEEYVISLAQNPLVASEEQAVDIIVPLLSKFQAASYAPYTLDWMGNPAAQAGDIVWHTRDQKNGNRLTVIPSTPNVDLDGSITLEDTEPLVVYVAPVILMPGTYQTQLSGTTASAALYDPTGVYLCSLTNDVQAVTIESITTLHSVTVEAQVTGDVQLALWEGSSPTAPGFGNTDGIIQKSLVMNSTHKFAGLGHLSAVGTAPEEHTQLTASAKAIVEATKSQSKNLNDSLTYQQQLMESMQNLATTALGFVPQVTRDPDDPSKVLYYDMIGPLRDDSDPNSFVVWRYSSNGIFLSKQGGQPGTFTSSWGVNDTIVAQVITADMITTGVLSALDKSLSIDFSAGVQTFTPTDGWGQTIFEGTSILMKYWNKLSTGRDPLGYMKMTMDANETQDAEEMVAADMKLIWATYDDQMYSSIGHTILHTLLGSTVEEIQSLEIKSKGPIHLSPSIWFDDAILFDNIIMRRAKGPLGNSGIDFILSPSAIPTRPLINLQRDPSFENASFKDGTITLEDMQTGAIATFFDDEANQSFNYLYLRGSVGNSATITTDPNSRMSGTNALLMPQYTTWYLVSRVKLKAGKKYFVSFCTSTSNAQEHRLGYTTADSIPAVHPHSVYPFAGQTGKALVAAVLSTSKDSYFALQYLLSGQSCWIDDVFIAEVDPDFSVESGVTYIQNQYT